MLCRPRVCSLGPLTKTTRPRIRWRTAGRRLALAVGDLLSTVKPSRRTPLPTPLPHTTLLSVHEPDLRRRLTSLAAMMTMAAGRHDTPGSPTEPAPKHGPNDAKERPSWTHRAHLTTCWRHACAFKVCSSALSEFDPSGLAHSSHQYSECCDTSGQRAHRTGSLS